jgi:cytochrome c-type biogenesis protein CcmH/NrfG
LKKSVQNPREVAEIVAVQALSFIAGDPERLGLFLAESGLGPETLRTAVKAFASASQLHPTNIAAARQVLGDPTWERDVP